MLSAAVMALFFGACERLMDGEGDCQTIYQVKLQYTRNILEADAFAAQVKSVSLFLFDRQGRCVAVQKESGDALAEDDYLMVLDDVPAGTYDMVAWCGLEGSSNFALDNAQQPQTKQDLICRLQAQSRGPVQSKSQLAPLWHGSADNVVLSADQAGSKVVATIDLTKDVNTVRIVMQHYRHKQIESKDFEFKITDWNGVMNYDNTLMGDDEVTYREWTVREAEVAMPGEDEDAADVTRISSLVAELDVARLVKSERRPVLEVRKADAEQPLLRLPLIDLLLVAKGEARRKMDDQEYLDRQDDYTLLFYINDDDGWYMNGGIWVNSWHIIENYPKL